MNKFFTSMFLLFFFLACEEQVLEQVENQESVESRLSSQNQSCVPKSVSYQECSDFKPYAKEASIILTCSDDGSTRFASECLVKSCSPGYINIGNNCVRQNCSPNSSFTVDCSGELPGAVSAKKRVTCSADGSQRIFGECVIQACGADFYQSGNTCLAKVCKQSSQKVDCTSQMPNASLAQITRTCNFNGSSSSNSACIISSCRDGFVKEGNSCVPRLCEPYSRQNSSCTSEIANSLSATKSINCNSTGSKLFNSTCNLKSCRAGYDKVGNSCVPKTCTPNQKQSVSCAGDISNAKSATKILTCNSSGSKITAGTCELNTCQNGYIKQGNTCVAQSCTPGAQRKKICMVKNSEIAFETLTCNSEGNKENIIQSCKVDKCLTGFTLNGNECVPRMCNPNETLNVSCHTDPQGVLQSKKSITCSADGMSQSKGTCSISCVQGYKVNAENTGCVALSCNPNEVINRICHSNPSGVETSTQTLTCNADGTESILGSCNIKCKSGYLLSSDKKYCQKSMCTPGEKLVSSCHGDDSSIATSAQTITCNQNGDSYIKGACSIVSCSDGFEFNESRTSCIGRSPAASGGSWFDYSQAENRYTLLGSNSSTHAYAKENQSCKDWLNDKQIDFSQIAVSRNHRDGAFIHFQEKKWNGVPYHFQDFSGDQDNLDVNKCLYRIQLSNRKTICSAESIDSTFESVKAKHEGRMNSPDGSQKVESVRAVAVCNSTQGDSSNPNSYSMINANYKLQLKLNTTVDKAVLFDARFFSWLGVESIPKGSDGESAIKYFVRLNIDKFINSPSKQLFSKLTWGDAKHEEYAEHDDFNFYSKMSHHSHLPGVGMNSCVYEIIDKSSTNGLDCKVSACNTGIPGWRPALKCNVFYSSNVGSDNFKNRVRFKYEMGTFDIDKRTNVGSTLNTAANLNELGLDSRFGPDGVSAKSWLESKGINAKHLMTFTENLSAGDSYYRIEKFPRNTYQEFNRIEYKNYCPYEILNKGDGSISSTRSLKACLTAPCDSLPNYNTSSEIVRAVSSCTQLTPVDYDSVKKHSGVYKKSIHIMNDGVGTSSIMGENPFAQRSPASNLEYSNLDDLNKPSKSKMTCNDWLAENGINVDSKDIRTIERSLSTDNTSIPKPRNCAYIIKLTQNGTQKTFCESRGWDMMDFQGTFDQYDELIPVSSCTPSNNTSIQIETSVLRDVTSSTGPSSCVPSSYTTTPDGIDNDCDGVVDEVNWKHSYISGNGEGQICRVWNTGGEVDGETRGEFCLRTTGRMANGMDGGGCYCTANNTPRYY